MEQQFGRYTAGHPSLFQNPQMDNQLLKDDATARITDPNVLWLDRIACTNRPHGAQEPRSEPSALVDPKDPPFTKAEREVLKRKWEPMLERTLKNELDTLLFDAFFSKQNLATLQNGIRYAVHKWSGHNVGKQSVLELVLIMEHVYDQYVENIDEWHAPSKKVLKHISYQLHRLDNFVVNIAVPAIINQVEQHLSYMRLKEKGRTEESFIRPVSTKITGTMAYRASDDLLALTNST